MTKKQKPSTVRPAPTDPWQHTIAALKDHDLLVSIALAAVEHLADADPRSDRAKVLAFRLADWLRRSSFDNLDAIRGAAMLVFKHHGFTDMMYKVTP